MAVSTINLVKELARQTLNSDTNFLKRYLYFFELEVPAEAAYVPTATSYLFPLILPPTSYSMEEPFTVEATPTQGGGLYVEENGIIQRMIRLTGHTGFKPRNLNIKGFPLAAWLPPEKSSHGRELPDVIIGAISGHRHFQYLQDTVFRTYADLKRDPSTAKDTKLFFHNPRDQEHWQVVPQRFNLERDASKPLLYTYNIELLAVDKAEAKNFDFSDDQSLFDAIKDVIRSIKKAIDQVSGAFDDITALVAEAKSFVNDLAAIIDAVAGIIDAVTDFVDGVTSLIESPYAIIDSTIGLIESAMDNVNSWIELGETAKNFPETLKNKFNQGIDGLESLGQYPHLFETPTEATIRNIREQQESRRSISIERKEEALEFGSPTTFDEVRNLGTQLTAGDVQSAEGELLVGGTIKKYKSSRQVTVEQNDTLVSIAARYMGDARQWQYIAIVNGLKPPFIDKQASAPLVGATSEGSSTSGSAAGAEESPFADTLGIGSKILVPSNKNSPLQQTILPVLGAQLDEPVEDQFLGTDLKLEAVQDIFGSSRALYDIPINFELGSTDGEIVSGIDNLAQTVVLRLLTEKGQDTLYKKLGLQRIVSLGFTDLDLETARFRIREALLGDPRVAAIRNLRLEQEADQLIVDMDVKIHGFVEAKAVRVAL